MSKKYLLDTNILVHLLRGREDVAQHIASIGWDNCCMSEITMIELLYGAEVSKNKKQNTTRVEQLIKDFEVIPIGVCVSEFCRQKARLKRMGKPIEDFDLFIGATAIATNSVLVTENTSHLSRLEGITIENWIER